MTQLKIYKSLVGMLGTRTRSDRMEGAEQTNALSYGGTPWQAEILSIIFFIKFRIQWRSLLN